MDNFIFHAPTKIYFGKDQELKVADILKEYKAHKVLLHYGMGSIKKTGLYGKVINILNQQKIEFVELGEVEPNPKLSLVEKGISIVKSEKIDFILAIGGGSVIDSAKSIAVGAPVDFSPWEFSTHRLKPEKSLNLGVILTISASGSDMSDSCVITNEKTKEKRGFNSPFNRPKFAILNPELTYTVSPYQTACGIVDILMHTLERFISEDQMKNDLTDSIAIGLMKSVLKAGKIVMNEPDNYDARATLMWANSLSHNGLTSCGRPFTMSVHQLEHELSGMYDDIAHGAGLAALWPSWARNAYPKAIQRFKRFAYEVMMIQTTGSIEKDILASIDLLESYFINLGMPTTLKELKVKKESLTILARNVTFQQTRLIKDVITIDEQMALKIYTDAY